MYCVSLCQSALFFSWGPGGSMSLVVGLPSNSYKPITNTAWVRTRLCKLQKGCTRLASASDKVYQLLAHGRWFPPDTPASSTTKTGPHDIAEILLKVALNTKNQSTNQLIFFSLWSYSYPIYSSWDLECKRGICFCLFILYTIICTHMYNVRKYIIDFYEL